MSASRTELENELIELYEVIDERDARIETLEQELSQARCNSHNDNDRLIQGTLHQDERRSHVTPGLCDQLLEMKDENTDLRAKQLQLQQKNEELVADKNEIASQLKSQQNLVTIYKKRLSALSKLSDDYQRQRQDEYGQHYQLEMENSMLRDTLKRLEETEEELVAELEVVTLDRDDYAKNGQQWEAKCSLVRIEQEECEKRCLHLENDISKAKSQLECYEQEQEVMRYNYEHTCDLLRSEIDSSKGLLECEKRKCQILEKELEVLKDESLQGILKQKNLALSEEMERLNEKFQTCLQFRTQAEADLSNLSHLHNNFTLQQDKLILDAVVIERKKYLCLEERFEECTHQKSILESMNSDLEALQNQLIEKLRYAEERNSRYEETNGLKASAKQQRKLESDIIRRDMDITILNEKLGQANDRCQLLEGACSLLKEKGAFDGNTSFDDEELRKVIESNENKLELEIAELKRQNEILEKDRNTHLQQLRDNAADIGEKGTRFWGLNAKQMSQVFEFVNSIRSGSNQLPLDNKSKVLKDEVTRLSFENNALQRKTDGLEHEIIILKAAEESRYHQDDNAYELQSIHHILQDIKDSNVNSQQQYCYNSEQEMNRLLSLVKDKLKTDIFNCENSLIPSESATHSKKVVLTDLSKIQCVMKHVECQTSGVELVVSQSVLQSYQALVEKAKYHTASQALECQLEAPSSSETVKELRSHNSLIQTEFERVDVMKENRALLNKVKMLECKLEELGLKEIVTSKVEIENERLSDEVKTLKQINTDLEAILHAKPLVFEATQKPAIFNSSVNAELSLVRKGAPMDNLNQGNALFETNKAAIEVIADQGNASMNEAALGTISSLKQLLQEKNVVIDEYRGKLFREREQRTSDRAKIFDNQRDITMDVIQKSNDTAGAKLKELLKETNINGFSSEEYAKILAAQVDTAEQKINKLENELSLAKETEEDYSKKIVEYTDEIELMKTDINTIATTLQTKTLQVEDTQAKSINMEQELNNLRAQQRNNLAKIDGLRKAILRLKQELSVKNKDNAYQTKVNEKSDIDLNEINNLRNELRGTRLAKEKCIRALKATREKADNAFEDASRLEEQVDNLRKSLSESKREITILRTKLRRSLSSRSNRVKFDASERKEEDQEKLKYRILQISRQNCKLRGQLAQRSIHNTNREKKKNILRKPLSLICKEKVQLSEKKSNQYKK